MNRNILIFIILVASTFSWLISLHYFFRVDSKLFISKDSLPVNAEKMLNRHLNIWKDPNNRQKIINLEHQNNPEWDFMWRTFLTLSITNIIIREPCREKELLPIIDTIIYDTIKKIEDNSMYYFLMQYAHQSPWVFQPPASLFHDGEILLMINCRRLIKDDAAHQLLSNKFRQAVIDNMSRCPLLAAESYPNECWLFCNTLSLMALKIGDYLDNTDHSEFTHKWLAKAQEFLIDSKTGLLQSAFTIDGRTIHGPEGSSIWMASHCLNFVSPEFAKKQFLLAKKELYLTVLNFGFSREWPKSWKKQLDCDAGGIFALLDASPSASVFAILAAQTFNDQEMLDNLLTSMNIGGLPSISENEMKFNTSNLVGDASILYAFVKGAIERKISRNEQTIK